MTEELSTLNPLISITVNKQKHSQITGKKTEAHRAGGTGQNSKLLCPKPNTRKVLPLWTSLEQLNQHQWDFVSYVVRDFLRTV